MAAQSEPTHLDPQESSVCRKIQSLAELPLFFCKNCLSEIPAAVLSYRCKCCEEFDLCQHCYDSGIRCSDVTSHISKQRNFSDYMMEEASRTIYLSLFYRRYPVDSLCNQIRLYMYFLQILLTLRYIHILRLDPWTHGHSTTH